MGDYEDHDLLVARHTSSRKDRHRRKKYRRDRVRPEDHDDLVAGLRQSHDAWTDVVKDRHADDDRYDYEERRSRSASASPAKRPPQRRDDDDVMLQVQEKLATQLHRQEPWDMSAVIVLLNSNPKQGSRMIQPLTSMLPDMLITSTWPSAATSRISSTGVSATAWGDAAIMARPAQIAISLREAMRRQPQAWLRNNRRA